MKWSLGQAGKRRLSRVEHIFVDLRNNAGIVFTTTTTKSGVLMYGWVWTPADWYQYGCASESRFVRMHC